MANVTPKAILYKGHIVRFSNKELKIITTKAAYLCITPYESAKMYAANLGIAATPTQPTPTQPTPVQPKPTQTKSAQPNTALLAIYSAYIGNMYDDYTSGDAFEALVDDNQELSNAATCKATLEAFLADPCPINYNAINGALLLYQEYEH